VEIHFSPMTRPFSPWRDHWRLFCAVNKLLDFGLKLGQVSGTMLKPAFAGR
jgi:hypothetical protein